MRRVLPRRAAGVAGLFALLMAHIAVAAPCDRGQFEAVVDEAAVILRELTIRNKPALQDRLRLLRDKRGWSNDEFLKRAAPFVQDQQTEALDRRSSEQLAKITAMGQDGAAAREPDCAMLDDLRGTMRALVTTQQAKWDYLFGKLDAELAK
jgi:hypothetical protein